MTWNATVIALAALSLAGCVTTHAPGSLTPDPVEVVVLPSTYEPVKPERAARPTPVPAPADAPMTSSLLRARLVAFVMAAEARRSDAEPGSTIPESQLSAWERIQSDVDRFLGESADGDTEDIQVARGSLRAALDRDKIG